ncbi:MAG: hypothetical protein LBB88_03705 [Planctomycetaceae bacterium]|nr:hypothetical protein [Planctomycetaceae bacterium]
MSNPFYCCLRQRDLSAKGRLPESVVAYQIMGQQVLNMNYNIKNQIHIARFNSAR